MGFTCSIRLLSLALCLLLQRPSHAVTLHPRDAVPGGFEARPYYPAPHGGWVPSWKYSYAKAQKLVSQMTLAEKTNITGGVGIYMGKTWPRRTLILSSEANSRVGLVQMNFTLHASHVP